MRFTTLCGGLLPDCFMAQFTIFFNVTSRIHRCPQNRMSDARPQHQEHALLFTNSVGSLTSHSYFLRVVRRDLRLIVLIGEDLKV